MNKIRAVLDANVLYPAPLRDLLLQLAVMDVFQARWTEEIHQEWIGALLRNEPQRSPAALDRTRELMNRATRDCLITGFERFVQKVELPDIHDRHVVAAAIAGHCSVVVTQNLKHFPRVCLAPFGVEAQHPDPFLLSRLRSEPGLFCEALRKVRDRLHRPHYSVSEYLQILHQQGLIKTTDALKAFDTAL